MMAGERRTTIFMAGTFLSLYVYSDGGAIRWGRGYCQYMRTHTGRRKYSQKSAVSIDIFPVLWYPITIPLPKGA